MFYHVIKPPDIPPVFFICWLPHINNGGFPAQYVVKVLFIKLMLIKIIEE